MKTRKNHVYLPERDGSSIYEEFHVRTSVGPARMIKYEPTGRTFVLMEKFSDPNEADAYFCSRGEMKLWDYSKETCLILKRNEEEDGETDY